MLRASVSRWFKIGGNLRLAHEHDQLLITTDIIKYDENLGVVKAVRSAMKGNSPCLSIESPGNHDPESCLGNPHHELLTLIMSLSQTEMKQSTQVRALLLPCLASSSTSENLERRIP